MTLNLTNTQKFDRHSINDEIHARPFLELESPLNCTHFVFVTGENTASTEIKHLEKLCRHFDIILPTCSSKQIDILLGETIFRWERHNEFSTYSFIAPHNNSKLFTERPSNFLPDEWLNDVSGELLHAMHVQVEKIDVNDFKKGTYQKHFNDNRLIGGLIADGKATLLSDLKYDEDGLIKYILCDHNHTPDRMGRTLQYILELETYRMMALLAVPVANGTVSTIGQLETLLGEISHQMATIDTVDKNKQLMKKLMALSDEVEKMFVKVSYRLSATRAYNNIFQERLNLLREERITDTQRFTSFYARRLTPVMRTCESVSRRLQALSNQVAHNAAMLRTRVDLVLEEQNQNLLKSMNTRADIQLRLQETVEGLSVVAISYYLIGILGYILKALAKIHPIINPTLYTGALVPVLIFCVIMMVRRIKKKLKH